MTQPQLDDLIAILDKDGDGSIDYAEFARWFGSGPPPPPVLPEVAMREEAREDAGSGIDDAEHLREIRKRAKSMGTAVAVEPPLPTKKKAAPPMQKKQPPLPKGNAPKSSLPPPPKRGPPPPPPPPAVFAEARSNDEHLAGISASPTAARAVARSDDEHLNSVRNAGERRVNISEARGNDDHLDSIKMGGTVRGFNSLMGEIGAGAELRSAETVDKSGPVLESEDHDIASTESPALLLKDLIPFFPDTKEFLRKVETVDKSAPVIDEEIRITFTDPDDTTNPHLKAIAAAAEKRSYRLMMKLKAELSGVFSSSGITLERAFRGFDENRDGVIDHAEFERGLKSLGAEIEPQQLDDLIAILDKDGDGSIDYSEFARWFGAGPPPPPELPEVREREEARENAGAEVDSDEHLRAIRKQAKAMGSAVAVGPPLPAKKKKQPPLPKKKAPGLPRPSVPSPPKRRPPPPPLPPAVFAEARSNDEHLSGISASPTAARAVARSDDEHLGAIKHAGAVRGFRAMLGEIASGGANLKHTQTVDKSAPLQTVRKKKAPPPTPSSRAAGGAGRGGVPPPPKRGPPAPPAPPPATAPSAMRDDSAHLNAISSNPTAARAVARSDSDHLDAIKGMSTVRGFNGLMEEISAGAELRKARTVDKSTPVIEASGTDVTESPQAQLKGLIPFFPDTKEFLRKVETVDRSAPVIDEEIKITFTDPDDTRSPHLKAIAAAAEKRHHKLLHQLKYELKNIFTVSGISLERAFRGFDENRDGEIDHGEFSRGLMSLGAELEEQQMDALIAVLDSDGNGSIDYSEFARWFGTGPPPPPALPEVALREDMMKMRTDSGEYKESEEVKHLKAIRKQAVTMGVAVDSPAAAPSIPKGTGGKSPKKKVVPQRRPSPAGTPPARRATATRGRALPAPPALVDASEAAIVVNSLASCLHDAKAQHAGCYALWKMLYGSAGQRRAVASAGGVAVLMDALAMAPHNPALQEAGCAALASLVIDAGAARQASSAGASKLAMSAMVSHPGDAEVQAAALVLLANLSG